MSSNDTKTDVPYTISGADTGWILTSTCLVFIMIPGVGYFYSGITRKKSQLTILLTSGLALGIVSFEWWLWGYSLSFSINSSRFIGNLGNVAILNVGNAPHVLAPTIPENVFFIYECMFATITPVLAFGSAAERTTLSSYAIFLFVWSSLVYNFIAYWVWAPNGWLHDYGVLDFAGGTPVHLTSGVSALAYALCVGPRRTINHETYVPHSISDVFLGVTLLWLGWFGFNGGSELAINSRAANAVIVSQIAAGFGGLSWMFGEMIRHRRKKMSLNGFCTGAVVGLVAITPASGFVKPHYALIFGFLPAIICMYAVDIKKITRFKYDDACDVFAVHGVGGFLGCILTGVFAENSVITMSGDAAIVGGAGLVERKVRFIITNIYKQW
jgi:Amt family ammonium transporter